MTPARRPAAVLLLLAVVLGGVLVLRPTGTTLAAWSDEVTVAVPTLRTGGVRLEVAPAGTGTTATIGMTGEVAGTWRPSSVRGTADGRALAGSELAGSRIEYRVATGATGTCPTGPATYTVLPSGAATSFPVSGADQLSGARTVCLTFVPSDGTRTRLAGRTLSFTTSIDGVSAAPATWTAVGTWTVNQRLAPGASVSGPSCTPDHPRVVLGWGWERGGLGVDPSRWSLQAETAAGWNEVRSVAGANRSVALSPSEFNGGQSGTHRVRVVAVLPDGTTIAGTTTTTLTIQGAIQCG